MQQYDVEKLLKKIQQMKIEAGIVPSQGKVFKKNIKYYDNCYHY